MHESQQANLHDQYSSLAPSTSQSQRTMYKNPASQSQYPAGGKPNASPWQGRSQSVLGENVHLTDNSNSTFDNGRSSLNPFAGETILTDSTDILNKK